jgi:predicted Zn-dependent protease
MSEAIARTTAPLPAREQLETLVADILAEARAQGATAAEAAVSFGSALSVTVRLGEVETLEHHRQRGLYAINFGGGQVDITSGKFVFSASEAYLIENGRVTRPVKGATLIGNGPDVLTEVSMVGNDLQLDAGVGTCGKDGQSVPVGVGQPTLKVEALTVGGTQA